MAFGIRVRNLHTFKLGAGFIRYHLGLVWAAPWNLENSTKHAEKNYNIMKFKGVQG